MNMLEGEGEAMAGAVSGPVVGADVPSSMSFNEKVTTAVLGTMGTVLLVTLGVALRRKNKEQGAEDVAWGVSKKTIERLEKQLSIATAENDTLRQQRNEFEAAAKRSETNAKIAADAATTAQAAAAANVTELNQLRTNWLKAQRYIFLLKHKLAENNIPIPPEPVE